MCAFQRFECFGARMAPRVSIRGNGQIGLSSGALRLFGMENGDWKVELFYDPESCLIGFKPTQDEGAKFAVPVLVRTLKAGGQAAGTKYGQVSGRSFLERFQIPYREKTKAFDPHLDEASQLYVIDLTKERCPRRKKKSDPAAVGTAGATGAAGLA